MFNTDAPYRRAGSHALEEVGVYYRRIKVRNTLQRTLCETTHFFIVYRRQSEQLFRRV